MVRSGDAAALYAARPEVTVDGRVDEALGEALHALEITEDLRGMARCEVTFNNWGPTRDGVGFLFFDRRSLDFGKALAIKLGRDTLFEGRVSGLEGDFPEGEPPRLVALVEDRLQDLRMTRRTRSFERVSDADVIRQVASDHGLRAEVTLTGPVLETLAQVNQSDLGLLQERARARDAELWVEGRTLHARPRGSDDVAPPKLRLQEGLWSFRAAADLAHQRTAVAVTGWDVSSRSAIRHEADASSIRGELGDDEGGARLLASTFGSRTEVVAHTAPATPAEARAEAEAIFRARARRFVSGHGVARPDAQLRAGRRVELEGLGPLFSGRYLLTEVRFVYDPERGMRVEFAAEKPGVGRRA